MVYEEDFLVRWESEVQRGGRCDLEETVGLEEEGQGGHERRAVSSWDVHRVCRPANEAIAVSSHECGQTIALRLGHLVNCLHANGQSDMRRPAGIPKTNQKKGGRNNNHKNSRSRKEREGERGGRTYPHLYKKSRGEYKGKEENNGGCGVCTYHQSSLQPFQGVVILAGSGEMFAGGAWKLAFPMAAGSSAGFGT